MNEEQLVESGRIPANQSEEIKSILAKCYKSTGVMAKTLFPERFHLPFSSKIHNKIFELIDDDSLQKVAIAAPRGIGKTSIANLVCPARGILFNDRKYIVPISSSADAAIEQSENLKFELESNPTIKSLFPSFKTANWSQERWDTVWGTRILPRGAGQQVRGRLYRNYRPDLIIVDDLEDSEHMDSDEQRRKKKLWFFSDVCNSVNRWSKDWRIIVLGTVLHEDSLLVNLLNDPSWHSVTLEICDDDFKSNWPEYMSDKAIEGLYNELDQQGIPDSFYREYRNIPISLRHAAFTKDLFSYYDEEKEKLNEKMSVESVIIADPAKTVHMKSADSAVVGLGVDLESGVIYVRDVVAGRMHPSELYDAIFDMAEKLRARTIGIEVTSLHEFITYPFKNEMIKRGLFYEIVELNARRGASRGEGKNARIGALSKFYRKGEIKHNKERSKILESQLLTFPKGKRKDVADATAYIIEMMDMGLRFFYPRDYEESPEEIEKEFAELGKDDEPALDRLDWAILP